MDLKRKFRLFDYFIEEDLILYHKAKSHKNKQITVKSEFGLAICEIEDYSSSYQKILKILDDFQIDSHAIEIEVKTKSMKYYLILKMIGINYDELKIRYNNFKKIISSNTNLGIVFLKFSKLETIYLAIIGNKSILSRSTLKNCTIIRSEKGFYLQPSKCSFIERTYFFLNEFNIETILLDKERINLFIGLLQTADIEGRIVLNIGKKDKIYEYSCYFICTSASLVFLEEFLQKNLNHLKIKIKNVFHPYFLGRILLREVVKPKNKFVSKKFYSLFTQLDRNIPIEPVQKFQIEDLHVDKLVDKQKNREIKEKLKNLNNIKGIETFIKKIDPLFLKSNEFSYTVFNHAILIFIITKIETIIINDLIEKINSNFDYIVVFAESLICESLKSLVNLRFTLFNRFIFINEIDILKNTINNLVIQYKEY